MNTVGCQKIPKENVHQFGTSGSGALVQKNNDTPAVHKTEGWKHKLTLMFDASKIIVELCF